MTRHIKFQAFVNDQIHIPDKHSRTQDWLRASGEIRQAVVKQINRVARVRGSDPEPIDARLVSVADLKWFRAIPNF